MRLRPLFWALVSIVCFIGAVVFWRLGNDWQSQKASRPNTTAPAAKPAARQSIEISGSASAGLFVHPPATNSIAASNIVENLQTKYRVSNTPKSAGELLGDNQAILLANALIDLREPLKLSIPDSLRAKDEPGAFIVQSSGPIDDSFRARVSGAGTTVISYIPNNAFLVQASANVAEQLRGASGVQAVLPYEPYYKLDARLLRQVIDPGVAPVSTALSVVAFPNSVEATVKAITDMGGTVVGESTTPFGQQLTVHGIVDVPAIASLPGVGRVEAYSSRRLANDLARARVGVANSSTNPLNYLSLTGSNIIVQVNDSGVNGSHPDLSGRVFGPASTSDLNGHGTHVGGIIAGNGSKSTTVSNAPGSIMPPVDKQFRGMAEGSRLFAMPINDIFSDLDLQESAARTNALISNNSWGYSDNTYDIASASFDAAVRDSLSGVTGSQPVLYVFAAGNDGGGGDNGLGGFAQSVLSPGTAKNVITVGAIEQFRNITNEVVISGETNAPWAGETDSANQVAGFSARGNVGIGVEGDFGRFKPDVVAPGVFVVSTRSPNWDTNAYYSAASTEVEILRGLVVQTNDLQRDSIFVPYNALQMTIRVTNTIPHVDNMPIYLKEGDFPTVGDFAGYNEVTLSLPALTTATTWYYSVGNPTNVPVTYDVIRTLVVTNDLGTYYEELAKLNNGLGDNYRYESGTSMATPVVSGTLALIADFFTNKLGRLPSPALMKAMVINGARSVDDIYDLSVTKDGSDARNYQGWGLINLSNSLHSALMTNQLNYTGGSSMLVFDQSPTNTLSTAQRSTIKITVDPTAKQLPLRVTLVWTDPPGNPSAGVKLVNDLDLVVTNLDNPTEYFVGNDILAKTDFNQAGPTNGAPTYDSVNNVENVYIPGPLSTNYSVTVVARAVNVNAVTAHPNQTAQDYALVVSSGNGQVAKALKITPVPLATPAYTNITYMTNQFAGVTNAGMTGGLLLNQHVGANSPLIGDSAVDLGTNTIWGGLSTNGMITLGVTNQWHFYVLTNENSYTNAAFLTFLPPTLAIPRMGVTNYDNPDEASRVEADIDLFVSRDPGLLRLDPAVLGSTNTLKSVGRGGTEVIAITNALPGVYYVGVQSEDQQAAEYGFFGGFSELPFSQDDLNGTLVRGINVPINIPDGSPASPGVTRIIGICVTPMNVRRAIVEHLDITHENFGDLLGALTHNQAYAVLHNHQHSESQVNFDLTFEDNGENDYPNAQPSDGPGNLRNFVGESAAGLWLLTEIDSSPTHTGRVNNVSIRLQPQINSDGSVVLTIAPESFAYDYIDVPPEATNLTISIENITSGQQLPLELYVKRGDFPSLTDYEYRWDVLPGLTNVFSINRASFPPLQGGRYFIGVYNPNLVSQKIRMVLHLDLSVEGVIPDLFTSTNGIPILDDAVTYSTIEVSNCSKIVRADVAVSIDHPRVSDLALTVVSPSGKRILLYENRGGSSLSGLGGSAKTTNYFGTATSGGPEATVIPVTGVPTNGTATLVIDADFFNLSDTLDVYYDGVRVPGNIIPTGPLVGQQHFIWQYPAGTNTSIQIVVNAATNSDPNTLWTLTPSVITDQPLYFTFSENTNKAFLPVKFALNTAGLGLNGGAGDFEAAAPGEYLAVTNVDGWTVVTNSSTVTNQVSVMNDPLVAAGGSKFLALANGTISNVLTGLTLQSRYVLTYSYRGPGIVSWWRGENPITITNPVDTNQVTTVYTNAFDSIGNNTGYVQSNSLTTVAGRVGQAFRFNGDPTNCILITNSASLRAPSYTVDGWILSEIPFGDPTNRHLIFGQRAGHVELVAHPGSAPQTYVLGIGFSIDETNSVELLSTNQLPNGAYTYVAGTWDGAALRLFVNGVLDCETNVAGAPRNSGCNFFIGGYNESDTNNAACMFSGDYFNGGIDELSYYQRPLSPSEIKAIYVLGQGGQPKSDGSAVPPPQSLAVATLDIPGVSTSTFYGNNTNWLTQTVTFTAVTPTLPIQITGLSPGMLLDSFKLFKQPEEQYVMPEESLNDLVGDSACGTWKLEIWDSRASQFVPGSLVEWQLRFIFETNIPAVIPLVHDVPVTNTIASCGESYFYVDVPPWAKFATNSLLFATAPVTVYFSTNNIATTNDTVLIGPASNGGSATLDTTNSTPQLVPGTRYFLTVQNPCSNGTNVTFAIKVEFDITALSNTIPVVSTNNGAFYPRYFSYVVSSNATAVSFQLTNLTGNFDLVARKAPNLPTLTAFNYGSFNLGTNDEEIFIFTNSVPTPLTPGKWYLGVYDRDFSTNSYTIVAIEYTNDFSSLIRLTNSIPYSNSVPAGVEDYYVYRVSPLGVRAQFEINNPSGDMTLVIHKGLPLPTATLYDAISTNDFLNDELIVLTTNSTPVMLTPGDWFLTAINVSGAPVTYSIKATEWPSTGQPITVTDYSYNPPDATYTNGSFCITWNSLPGVRYYVQGISDLATTNWIAVSPTITATDYTTSYCVPITASNQFFRVVEGIALSSFAPPQNFTITAVTNNFLLQWRGSAVSQYQLQWTTNLAPAFWTAFSPTNMTSTNMFAPHSFTNGIYSFLDDGTQAGFPIPRAPQTFYRVLLLP